MVAGRVSYKERHKTQKFGRKAISEVPEIDHCPRICSSDGQFRMSVIARRLVSGTMTFIRNRSPIGANWPRRGLSPNGGGSKRNSGRDDENVEPVSTRTDINFRRWPKEGAR